MRVFKANWGKDDGCPLCKTRDQGDVVLVGIEGTQEGNNIKAQQFHLKCLNLRWDKTSEVLYQFPAKKKEV